MRVGVQIRHHQRAGQDARLVGRLVHSTATQEARSLVDIELPKLKSANSKSHEFEARCKVLQDLVEHHIKEEEGEMFVAARQLFSEDQLRDLGELMQQRKETIEAMSENPLIRPVKKLQSTVQKAMPSRVKAAKATAIAKAMERKEAR